MSTTTERRNRHRASGLCTECGKVPHSPGYLTCDDCREYHKGCSRAYYNDARNEGLCGICRKFPVEGGRSTCGDCRKLSLVYARANFTPKTSRRVRCSNCGGIGHFAKTCETATARPSE